ncbi:phospholipase A1 [Anabrus simplex]|uniref:phospholipase A1 n=1 Tax=Anabrus simplex TaxID=316456 RepID=UPI0035A28040
MLFQVALLLCSSRLALSGSFRDFIPNVKGCTVPAAACPNSNISFYLYTQENEHNPHRLDVSKMESITGAPFSAGKPAIVLIHGYTGHRDYSPNKEIRPAYLSHGDYNIISVDYQPLALPGCYVHAAYSTTIVGNCTAQVLDAVMAAHKMKLSQLHVIGFSLGGQVASQIPLFLKTGAIPRITGLDPAQPLFVAAQETSRLSADDADFVDVIHTNSGVKGVYAAVGDVDFYVNGGSSQPGCDSSYPDGGADSCSHARAPAFYAESISSESSFWGYRCRSWVTKMMGCYSTTDVPVIMGEKTPPSARGVYYVKTRARPPFALGKGSSPCPDQRPQ